MGTAPVAVEDYWRQRLASSEGGVNGVVWVESRALDPRRPAMMLERPDGWRRAVVRPELAQWLGGGTGGRLPAARLAERLRAAGVAFHDPDLRFYLPPAAAPGSDPPANVRRLCNADRATFDAFAAQASAHDRDAAYIELDHWAVFGCFDGERLVSAASAIPWADSPLADLGVLTLAVARGRGFGRAVVEACGAFARAVGREHPYRCQADNAPSIALAQACGFALFGTWWVAEV